jgi:hypothetical protein
MLSANFNKLVSFSYHSGAPTQTDQTGIRRILVYQWAAYRLRAEKISAPETEEVTRGKKVA